MAWKVRRPNAPASLSAILLPVARLKGRRLARALRTSLPAQDFVKVVQWMPGVPGAALLFRIRWRPGLVHP